jgi:hypothetical protein
VVDLNFFPNNPSYTYYWFTEDPKVNPSATGVTGNPYKNFGKDPDRELERFYVRVHNGSDWVDDKVYPVNVFLVPDSLVWTGGAGNNDWNNPANWTRLYTPLHPHSEAAPYRIPGACTQVKIPAGKTNYPVLGSQASAPTVYGEYLCNRIWFDFGGETSRTDTLTYSEAFVDVTLNSNQWYLFSSPLKNFYPGDFYVNTPNPYNDGYFIEPMFLEVANPQTGLRTSSAQWTGSFNNPDIPLTAGKGVAVWVDKRNTWYDNHDPVTFRFPKSDPFYYYYTDYGQQLDERTPDLTRTRKNRFVYEGAIDANGIVTWQINDVKKDTMILIGNPFMAHLDFEKFAALNSAQIEDEYKFAYGVTSTGTETSPSGSEGMVREFLTRRRDGAGYLNIEPYSDGSSLSSYIAPMQAFVIRPKNNGVLTLKADIKDTGVKAGASFRSAQDDSPERTLRINATRGNHTSQALLLQRENASHNYVPTEDSRKLFPGSDTVSVMVYTRSSDNYALDINAIGNLSQETPIGIRTSKQGDILLKFSGMESFDNGTVIYLHDRLSDLPPVNLTQTNEYSFKKLDSDLYLENRFFLTFSGGTDIRETPAADVVLQYLPDRTVHITTDNGSPLGQIQITDIQGKSIISQNVKESAYSFHSPSPGVYIVRVTNRTGTRVEKLGIKN